MKGNHIDTMGRYRVLIVDDDEAIRKMLGRFLTHLAYEVVLAGNTVEAIDRLEQTHFDIVLSDVRMPGPDGIELLGWITAHRPETGVVMLSGCDDVRLAVKAMRSGALDYIVKPFELQDVAETLGKAIGKQQESLKKAHHLLEVESALEQQAGELRNTVSQLREASAETMDALVTALDARERETQAHSKRVSEYSVYLAREFGIDGSDLEIIRQGAMLHDIGKIGISDRILLKPSPLTEEEWVEMRKHPAIGSWIVNGVEALKPAAQIVIAHHERYDGSGYPYGLSGEDIPFGARLFAISDCLDAVLSDRPYRSGQSYERAREEVESHASSQFDPQVAQCFLRTPAAAWERIREQTSAQHHSGVVLA